MLEETRTIETADGPMGVRVVRPDGGGQFPVIVYFHHGPGMTDASKESMRWIAAWGYYVVSHDRYHRDAEWFVVDPKVTGADEAARNRVMTMVMKTTDTMVATDVDAVLAFVDGELAARSAPYGCIGFCIGARSVLRTLQSHNDIVRVGVGMHPSLCTTDDDDSPHLAVTNLEGSLYLGFGSEDQSQPVAANIPLIEAIRAKGDGFEAEVHDGADHGFGLPGPAYHNVAADRSYERAKALFSKELS